MKSFTLYGLRRAGEKQVRYIGVTCRSLKRRLTSHQSESGANAGKDAWFNAGPVEIVPYAIDLDQKTAWELEIFVISELRSRGFELLNIQAGGGKPPDCSGKSRPPEVRKKIRVALTGRSRPDSVKRKLRVAHTGSKRSAEHRANISESIAAWWAERKANRV